MKKKMQLEQLMYKPRLEKEVTSQSKEKVYQSADLEYLSAVVLYGNSGPLRPPSGPLRLPSEPLRSIPEMKFFKETFRFDSHLPLGNHLNYETWLKKIGPKKGRYFKLGNLHIPLDDD